jgi:hypothetical protein
MGRGAALEACNDENAGHLLTFSDLDTLSVEFIGFRV